MSEEQSQLTYEFALEDENKPLSETEISQIIQNEKNKTTFMAQLKDSYYNGSFSVLKSITICMLLLLIVMSLADAFLSLITSTFNISYILMEFLLFLSMVAMPPILGILSIFIECRVNVSLTKNQVKRMTEDPNYIFNDDLYQLNDRLVDKNEPYKVRYLHELIKENKYVHYDTSIDNSTDKGILTITINENFKDFNEDNYSNQDLEFINQYNDQYQLNSNKDAIQFFEQYVDQYIDKEFLNSRFDAQSLQEIHDKSEKIKYLSQRN